MKTEKIMILFIIIGVIFICGCMGRGPSEAETTTTTTLEFTTTTAAPSGEISLEDISNLGKPSGYTVAYDITVSTEGETNRMTQTHYLGGKKFRLDMTDTVEGETEMRFYNIPGGTYICVKIQGAWNCIGGKTQEDAEFGFDIENMTSEIEEDLAKSIYDGTQVIAGVTAQCFRVTVSKGTMRYCVHSNYNIPLLMESTETAMGREKYIKIIATSFTLGAPSDSVFELPAEPIDLSGITDLLPK
ncbi:MAG: hypothetical protein DRO89_05465 [Candidatus Altiarchaeales archaeon]|nr:MAG: hypothetical protein DRO89_05465 [Candidatus Altiarchaeales archaeon]